MFQQGRVQSRPAVGSSPVDRGLLERSALHREYVAEREEILRLKWLESEKAGQDIGLERARTIWVTCHRALWRKARRLAGMAG